MTDLPFTVLAGYLGAGKTTLLNRLLAEPHGQRLAVLVNDFGSVDVDAALITAHDGTTLSMANGCACCTIGDDLGAAILQVRALGTFDRIVLEASGVADPARLAEWATLPGLVLGGIVVLADACTVAARADDRYVGDLVRAQLAAADVLVLTKTDLADEATRVAAAAVLRAGNPEARIVEARSTTASAAILVVLPDADEVDTRRDGPHEHHRPIHDTVTTSTTIACDRATLVDLLERAPGLERAKGIVRCAATAGDGHETVLVQATGGRVTVDRLADATSLTGLVLIGITGVARLDELARALGGA